MPKTRQFEVKPGRSFFVGGVKHRAGDPVDLTTAQAKRFAAMNMIQVPLTLDWDDDDEQSDDSGSEPAGTDGGEVENGDGEDQEENDPEPTFITKRGKPSR